MSPSLHDLGIDHLTVEDRLAIAQQLWESVTAELEAQPLSDAQRVELERRIAAADSHPDSGVTWEEVRAAARSRWSK